MKAEFEFTGGALCLDFANTVNHRGQPRREEDLLASYRALLQWSQQAGSLGQRESLRLERQAERKPAAARSVLARARALREAVYRLFARASDASPAAELGTINQEVAKLAPKVGIGPGAGRYSWQWTGATDDLARVLWPVLRNALELLTMEGRHVGVCQAKTCNWLFLDTTRNHTRRWCDMKVCGNRAKARRYYRRHARR
jgi:predicted RNA-binding Zn ribbon-like protein